MELASKTAIVIGVSSELGQAIAGKIINEEAFVYGVTRSVKKLNKLEGIRFRLYFSL